MIDCRTHASSRTCELVTKALSRFAAQRQVRRIVIKPNWVMHEVDAAFPIRALVTDPKIIDATIAACLRLIPEVEMITVGDCPLQSADWPLMCRQSGMDRVIEKYSGENRVRFLDLRKHAFKVQGTGADTFLDESNDEHGDPRGYREVELGKHSHLEPISDQSKRFAVNDYSNSVTSSNHAPGTHRYLVSQTVLDADLLINLPKWKSHQKSGITCALKNLVGINGDKAYLPHFRRGAPKWGGDEYRNENRWLYWAQTTLRESVQKRSRLAYRILKPGWEFIKKARGIETRMTDTATSPKQNFYVAGGAWWGNDTIWRMIYDLNLIIRCVDSNGKLHQTSQRDYFCIVDGLVSGEGNGPLQPLPKETGWLVSGEDPFALDAALSWFMGFEPDKLPIIEKRAQFAAPGWGDFDLNDLEIELDGQKARLKESEINFHFAAPPGWKNHVER